MSFGAPDWNPWKLNLFNPSKKLFYYGETWLDGSTKVY